MTEETTGDHLRLFWPGCRGRGILDEVMLKLRKIEKEADEEREDGKFLAEKNSTCEGLEAIKGGVLNCIFIGPKQSSIQGGEGRGVRWERSVGPCLATLNMDVIYAPEQIKEQINEQMIAESSTLCSKGIKWFQRLCPNWNPLSVIAPWPSVWLGEALFSLAWLL